MIAPGKPAGATAFSLGGQAIADKIGIYMPGVNNNNNIITDPNDLNYVDINNRVVVSGTNYYEYIDNQLENIYKLTETTSVPYGANDNITSFNNVKYNPLLIRGYYYFTRFRILVIK